MTLNNVDREAVLDMPNRLGKAGIEFIDTPPAARRPWFRCLKIGAFAR